MFYVSIPFKRESLSKATANPIATNGAEIAFQFPSNGKAYPKTHLHWKNRYSQSFNSLQTGKQIQSVYEDTPNAAEVIGFNSLQTGKQIQSLPTPSPKRKR